MTNNKDQQPSLEILLYLLYKWSSKIKLSHEILHFGNFIFTHVRQTKQEKKILIVFKDIENHLKSCHHHFI